MKDELTMHLLKRKVEVAVNARVDYYNMLCAAIEEDLSLSGTKFSSLPFQNPNILNYYDGSHFRSMSFLDLDERIELMKERMEEDQLLEFEMKINLWKKSLLQQDGIYYFKCGGEPLWLFGLYMKINLKFEPYKKSVYGKRQEFTRFKKPANQLPLLSIYFRSVTLNDNLGVLMRDERLIPDLDFLLSNGNLVSGIVQDMARAMKKIVTSSDLEELSKMDPTGDNVNQLYGLTTNSIQFDLKQIEETASLKNMDSVYSSTLASGIRKTTDMMLNGELSKFSYSAKLSLNYRDIAIQHTEALMHEREQMDKFMMEEEKRNGSSAIVNSNQQTCHVKLWRRLKRNLDLCVMNQNMVDELQAGARAYYIFQTKAAWGTPITMCDLGGACFVMFMNEQGQCCSVAWRIKKSGVGADSVIGTKAQIELAVKYIITCMMLRQVYFSGEMSDKTKYYMSSMAMAMAGGSGVKHNANGKKALENQSISEFGTQICLTEKGKHNHLSNQSKEEESNIEKHLNESGTSSDQIKTSWDTTRQGGDAMNVKSYAALPLLFSCSNLQAQYRPKSMESGQRERTANSPSLDGDVGVFSFKDSSKSKNVTDVDSNDSMRDYVTERKDQRAQIRKVGELMVKKWPGMFLQDDYSRRYGVFLDRAMTNPKRQMAYVHSTDLKNIDSQISKLTREVRKHYLDSDAMHRGMEGAWKLVAIPANKFDDDVTRIFVQKMERPVRQVIGKKEIEVVDFQSGVYDNVKSTLNIPWSINTILGSLYTHLSGYVIDPTSMILTCYQLCTMNFNSHCPPLVLALVVLHGYDALDTAQKKQYDEFSHWVLSLFDKKGESGHFVKEGYHIPKDGHKMKTWLNHRDDMCHRSIQNSHAQITALQKTTVYACPNIAFVEVRTPEWANMKKTGFRNSKSKESVVRSEQEIIAEVFASEQAQEACDSRKRNSPNSTKPYHDTYNIWKTICKGTNLPESSTHGEGNMKVTTEAAYMSGTFYLNVIKNLDHAKGVVSLFMALLNMKRNETRQTFMQKIFQSYIDRHHSGFVFPSHGEWNLEILGDLSLPCFKFGASPVVEQHTQLPYGVHVNLGCDLLWLVIGQSLYTSEWSKKSAILHTRNTCSATLNLLSIWMHTSTNKSIIPPCDKNKRIALPSVNPDPKMKKSPCFLSWEPRVHADSFHKNEFTIKSVLSENVRRKIDFSKVELKQNEPCLYYDRILNSNDESWMPDEIFQLTNGPPESWAHAQPFYHMQKIAMARFYLETFQDENLYGFHWEKCDKKIFPINSKPMGNGKLKSLLEDKRSPVTLEQDDLETIEIGGALSLTSAQNVYEMVGGECWRPVRVNTRFEAIAMYFYGQSVTAENMQFIPIQLTYCSMAYQREIPCVSFINGYLFVIQVLEKGIRVKPISKTHETSIRYLRGEDDFSRLPVEEKYINGGELQFFMNIGIVIDESCVKIVRQKDYQTDRKISQAHGYSDPAYFFQTIHWPTLVEVQVENSLMIVEKIMALNEDIFTEKAPTHMYVVNVRMFFRKMIKTKVVKSVDEAWFQENSDIVRPLVGDLKIVTSGVEDEESYEQYWIIIQDSEKGSQEFHFFVSREHLKYTMQRNGGECMGKDDYKRWTMREYIATSSIVADHTETQLFKIFETDKKLTVMETQYNDQQYHLLLKQLKRNEAYMERAGFQNSAKDIQEDWRKEIANLRLAMKETKVTKQVYLEVGLQENMVPLIRPHDIFVDYNPKLAIIWPYEEDGLYMRDGCYQVKFVENNLLCSNEMDFIAVSTCSLREGEKMFLNVDSDVRNSLAGLGMGVCLEEECQIECFYILHDTYHGEVDSYPVKILLEMYRDGEEDADEELADAEMVMLMCVLFDENGEQRMSTVRDFNLKLAKVSSDTDTIHDEEKASVLWKVV